MDARTAVLREIAQSGPISRADLARKLGLSGPSVTEATKQLVGQGLVEEVEQAPSTGGRPAIRLGLVKRAAQAIGVKLTDDRLVGVVVDLEGNVLEHFSSPFALRGGDIPAGLASVIRPMLEDAHHYTLGVGIGLPGVVSAGEHGNVFSPMLGLAGADLTRELETELGTPVLIDNDVNTLAVAEVLYGMGRELRNFITVTVGRGIGLGIVINGEVYRGTLGAAEFGHVIVEPQGRLCECGNLGCLEAYISEPALLNRAIENKVLAKGYRLADLQSLASDEGSAAHELFGDAAAMLGTAVGNLVNVLAPECILISGEGANAWQLWESSFNLALRHTVYRPFADVNVILDLWDDAKWAQGAAALVLRAGIAPGLNDSPTDRQVRDRLSNLSLDEAV